MTPPFMKVQSADSNDPGVPTCCSSFPPSAVNSHTGLAPQAVDVFSSSADGTNTGKLWIEEERLPRT